jgi:hypothetical protein
MCLSRSTLRENTHESWESEHGFPDTIPTHVFLAKDLCVSSLVWRLLC